MTRELKKILEFFYERGGKRGREGKKPHLEGRRVKAGFLCFPGVYSSDSFVCRFK